ncbi:MAG: hypothetical protein L0I24_01475 [Pseudonocardia sp.]|nr:hypothetical protein [Pseudonocardia sp.]
MLDRIDTETSAQVGGVGLPGVGQLDECATLQPCRPQGAAVGQVGRGPVAVRCQAVVEETGAAQ